MSSEFSDTVEKRTVFVRNLSFEADHDALHAFFAEFAPLEFAKVVLHSITGHSRGSGFVKFVDAEDAARVLNEFQEPRHQHKFIMDGRTLHLSLAVSRQEANRLRVVDTMKSNHKGNENPKCSTTDGLSMAEQLRATGRNLHLARVGLIRAGTAAAEGLSKEDLAKREMLLQDKQAKLKNPHVFISDRRLCVRNLPLSVTDDQLRQVCLETLHNQNRHLVTECRVMRNLQPGRQQFRSLGYAFVSFKTHSDAMKVLNALNNNPNLFPNQRRPIVEFTLENMLALEMKRQRAEKSALSQAKSGQSIPKSVQRKSHSNTGKQTAPIKVMRKSKDDKTPMRILPKTLGIKRRHSRNRSVSLKKSSRPNKPNARMSRKQIRARRRKSLVLER